MGIFSKHETILPKVITGFIDGDEVEDVWAWTEHALGQVTDELRSRSSGETQVIFEIIKSLNILARDLLRK